MSAPRDTRVAGQAEGALVGLRAEERERLTLLVERYQRAQIPGWELVGKLLAETEALEAALRLVVGRLSREDLAAALPPHILARLLLPAAPRGPLTRPSGGCIRQDGTRP